MSDLTKQIRERLPILQVATDGGLYIQMKGKRHFALCVWHSEDTPSMELYPDQNKGYCHGCKKRFDSIDLWAYFNNCSTSDAIRRLKEQLRLNDGQDKQKSKITAVYDYKAQDGTLIYQVLRKEPKAFIQRRPDNKGGWMYDLQGVEPIPYRLPKITKAISNGESVLIVEGEKDADKLAAMGFASTCNSGGAGKWTEVHSQYLPPNTEVVIIPDNDDPGHKHAETIAAQLIKRGCRVKVINLPGISIKGDVSDWLNAGRCKNDLLRQIESAPYQEQEDTGEWQEPGQVQEDQLSPVEELSPEVIPESLKGWLTDIANRMQCPLEYPTIGAIVAASSIIGAGCAIRPKKNDDWEVIPNLWGGIVGRPSQMKSPALTEILKPLSKLEVDSIDDYENNQRLYDAKQERYKAQREAIKADMIKAAKGKQSTDYKAVKGMSQLEMEYVALEPPEEPRCRRFKTNDSTVEKLTEILQDNPRGILVFRDELAGLLASWDREDRQPDRAFYLEGWNGNQGYTSDRIGRGTTFTKNVCISILGGIQPSKLTAYLMQSAGNLTNDGMVQRFQLMVYPDEPKEWNLVDRKPEKEARELAYKVFSRLAEIDFLSVGAVKDEEEGRPYFRFGDEAQELFYKWLADLENRIRSEEHPLICEHLAKYRSLMPSLALVFHLIEVAAGSQERVLSVLSVAKAIHFVKFLESHARRIYGLIINVRPKSAAALAQKIKQGKVKEMFSARDIYRNEWHLLNTQELVEDACRELEEAGWIKGEKLIKNTIGGRPKIQYIINPKILGKNA